MAAQSVVERQKAREVVSESYLATSGKHFGKANWGKTHCDAWDSFGSPPRGHGTRAQERAMRRLIEAAAGYADAAYEANGAPIGDDYVLGEYWRDVVLGIRRLLDGAVGRLDCGTLYTLLSNLMTSQRCEDPDA